MTRFVVVLGAAVAFGGCSTAQSDSSDDFDNPDQRAVAESVEDFADSAQRADWDEVCKDSLTPALAQKLATLAKAKCADRIEDSLRDVSTWDVKVTKVAISGTNAVATVETDRSSQDDAIDDLQLQRDRDGSWRINGVGASRVPTER